MFAFRPWDCATRATDAPGCAHSISTNCLSATGCCRTFLRVACSIVFMTELSWTRDWLGYCLGSRWDGWTLTVNEREQVALGMLVAELLDAHGSGLTPLSRTV